MGSFSDDRGVKAVELGVSLLLISVFAALAGPALTSIFDTFQDAGAALEVRSAAVAAEVVTAQGGDLDAIEEALGDTIVTNVDGSQVAGVALERSTDGAVCLWRESAAGTVFAVWQGEGRTLYATFEVRPEACPTVEKAEALGFSPSF